MQISTFKIDDETFAIPALLVEEFFRPLPVTKVPGCDPRIDGLVNIRGRTSVVVDMRRCFGLPSNEEAGVNSEMILLETEAGLVEEAKKLGLYAYEEPIVLRVDSTSPIYNLEGDDIHPPPAHVAQNFIEGVVSADNMYFTILSMKRLVAEILNGEAEVSS